MSFSIPPDFCTTIVGHSKIIANSEPANHASPDGAVTAWVLFTPAPIREAILNQNLARVALHLIQHSRTVLALIPLQMEFELGVASAHLRPPDSPGVDWSLLIYNSLGVYAKRTSKYPRDGMDHSSPTHYSRSEIEGIPDAGSVITSGRRLGFGAVCIWLSPGGIQAQVRILS